MLFSAVARELLELELEVGMEVSDSSGVVFIASEVVTSTVDEIVEDAAVAVGSASVVNMNEVSCEMASVVMEELCSTVDGVVIDVVDSVEENENDVVDSLADVLSTSVVTVLEIDVASNDDGVGASVVGEDVESTVV